MIRKGAVAGSFYPKDETEISKLLTEYFNPYKNRRKYDDVRAIIVPHAGYIFSGEVAASAVASINPSKRFKGVFIIGSSHHTYLEGASINTEHSSYSSPLGDVKLDKTLINKLVTNNKCFSYNPNAHDKEHSIEVQLPFLQWHLKYMPPIIPIIIGTHSIDKIHEISMALSKYFNEDYLFVISSDFSHYPSYKDAVYADKITGESILKNDPNSFINALSDNHRRNIKGLSTSACGQSAILALLMISSPYEDIKIKHVMYKNSGDSIHGDDQRVVGYHSFVFIHTEMSYTISFELNNQEKQFLLKTARKAIIDNLNNSNILSFNPTELTQTLRSNCGAFVSLYKNGNLRGCIGNLVGSMPLYETIVHMAIAAAMEDPRFPIVSLDEMDDISIEISVLSPLKRIKSISEFELGVDGIFMRRGDKSGTFLPQVANDTNWTAEELFGHCAQDKAGIGWNGWKDAELYTYHAVVFNEYE